MLKSKSNNQRIILLGLSKTLDQNPQINIYIYIYIYKNKSTSVTIKDNKRQWCMLIQNEIHG